MADASLEPVDLAVVDTNTADWDKFPIPEIGAELDFVPLITDSDTGMMVLKMTYKAGFTNPWQHHGASSDEDCTFLFITNKPFEIHYVDR